MGMDGYRPSQSLNYTDPLGHLDAAERAKALYRKKFAVQSSEEGLEGLERDPKERPEQEKRDKKPKPKRSMEEELEDILLSEFQLNLDPNIVYSFDYNPQRDKIELTNTANGHVILTLDPDDFIRMTRGMKQSTGFIADQSA